MKITCSKSGIEFGCDYISAALRSGIVSHPIFYLPQSSLFSLSSNWIEESTELPKTDSYLLFLALLDSTGLVDWQHHVTPLPAFDSIIESNKDDLILIVSLINTVSRPENVFSRICISKENSTLENVSDIIANWQEQLSDLKDGYARYNLRSNLNRKEEILEKIIKGDTKPIVLATQIANWAEIAAQFPTFPVQTQFGPMNCNEYWKLLIRKCINADAIFECPDRDLDELITHCEENCEQGSIYAYTLMAMLRSGKEKKRNYLGLGDWDISTSSLSYLILDSDSESNLTEANLSILESSACDKEPDIRNYPSRFEYIKAKLKYQIKMERKQNESN